MKNKKIELRKECFVTSWYAYDKKLCSSSPVSVHDVKIVSTLEEAIELGNQAMKEMVHLHKTIDECIHPIWFHIRENFIENGVFRKYTEWKFYATGELKLKRTTKIKNPDIFAIPN